MSALPIGSVMSRSSVPVVRSRSIAIDVTRNITMNGNRPHSGAPIAWNLRSWPSNTKYRSTRRTAGTTSISATVRGSRRICQSTRSAVAHQQQPVALARLVHHVAGDEEGGAGGGELVERAPQLGAQHGVEPDGR